MSTVSTHLNPSFMRIAKYTDKAAIIEILAKSFNDNKSVNYVIKQDINRMQRIKDLVAYSFEICKLFGEVFISDDQNACALILFPEKKKTNFQTIMLDLQLIIKAVGWRNVVKTLKREKAIKQAHPQELLYHIWYVGVDPINQGKGNGSALLKEILQRAKDLNKTPVLETSTLRNIPWYQKHGFEIYNEINMGFPMYCLKA